MSKAFDGCSELGLTAQQAVRLGRLIRLVQGVGHGEVVVRISKGAVRFVSVRLEDEFEMGKTAGKVEEMFKST